MFPKLIFNLSPVSPALPSPWWRSWAPARAHRCILPTGKSRPAARSARSRSRTAHFGIGRRTSRASGCSPPSSCSGSRAWSPLYARPSIETARVLRYSGRSSAFFSLFATHFARENDAGRVNLSPQAHGSPVVSVKLSHTRGARISGAVAHGKVTRLPGALLQRNS